jgi:hypothetical protein
MDTWLLFNITNTQSLSNRWKICLALVCARAVGNRARRVEFPTFLKPSHSFRDGHGGTDRWLIRLPFR